MTKQTVYRKFNCIATKIFRLSESDDLYLLPRENAYLKKVSDAYILDEQELLSFAKKIAEDSWTAGMVNGFNNGKFGHSKNEPSKSDYCNNLSIEKYL